MSDIFQKKEIQQDIPLTADASIITWDGQLAYATQVSVTYSQQITRRRTIGGANAVIYASQPNGQINIQRLVAQNWNKIFKKDGWGSCEPVELGLKLGDCNKEAGSGGFKFTNCIVSQYSIQLEAESTTVADNLVIDFLQMIQD